MGLSLGSKDAPYLVTILVACLGWSITHLAGRVLDAPTVEYRTNTSSAKGPYVFTVHVTNLSKKAFFKLEFEIQAPDIAPCETPLALAPPAWSTGRAPVKGTNGVVYFLDQLQPGWEVEICSVHKSNITPIFVLKNAPEQALELVQPSLRTFIARNEVCLLLALVIALLVAFVTWLWPSGRSNTTDKSG